VLRRAVGRKERRDKKKYTPNTPNTLQYLAQSLGTERAPATAKQKQKSLTTIMQFFLIKKNDS
jgi:hypothetical protein